MQLLCAALALMVSAARAGEWYRLAFIDVGYGLSVLVQDSSGTALLMDGGYREEAPMVQEILAEAGVDSLALMIASHGHGDHLEGLALLLQGGFPVGMVIGNVPRGHASFDSLFWSALGEVPYRQVHTGDSLEIGAMALRVLHPDTLTTDLNESSMAVLLRLGTHTVMLPSDIGVLVQEGLAQGGGDGLRSDILAAPHHGDVIEEEFWQMVNPAWILLPVGPNPWELPDSTMLRMAAGRRLCDTRRDGTVIISLDDCGITVASQRIHHSEERRETEMAARLERWRHGR